MLDKNTFFDSYTRIFGEELKVDATGNRFLEEFYRCFIASSEEVAAVFQNTDMEHQRKMLKNSLFYGINFLEDIHYFEALHRIAVSHSKKRYNIKPELYDLWLDCMVETVQKFDPEFSDDVELSWRLAFSQTITYMKFMYTR
ncbi:MAG: globin domain-containing protein [Pseudomonadota bacterium]|nr:globin domain-containing protein [Pseudomonadota bacterium]